MPPTCALRMFQRQVDAVEKAMPCDMFARLLLLDKEKLFRCVRRILKGKRTHNGKKQASGEKCRMLVCLGGCINTMYGYGAYNDPLLKRWEKNFQRFDKSEFMLYEQAPKYTEFINQRKHTRTIITRPNGNMNCCLVL